MLKPLNKDVAFAAIANDLELPIVLLSSPDPQVRLAMLDKIGAALLSTNLTWRDVAERLVAPQPAKVAAIPPYAPPPYSPPMPPQVGAGLDPADAVAAAGHGPYQGYRGAGKPLGYPLGTEIPGVGTVQPDGTLSPLPIER